MQTIHSIIILDMATVVILSVLASLSKPLGDALKIRPYFRLFYLAAALVLFGSLLDSLSMDATFALSRGFSEVLSGALRLTAGLISVGVCQRYWKWLFGEFFKK